MRFLFLFLFFSVKFYSRQSVYRRTPEPGQVVTFAQVGRKGRLGNQLFQIAATIGLAETHNYSWEFFTNIDRCAAGRLFNLHGSLSARRRRRVIEYKEQSQLYYDVTLPKGREHDIISLDGYFQDYRYFNSSLNTLDKYLQLPPQLVNLVRRKVPEVDSPFSVALHVRRGDYLKLNSLYNVLDASYYLRAISSIDGRIDNVIIVSNDIAWCEESLSPKIPYRIVYSPFKDELADFVLLHLSKTIIIANSSFSWWAAFLKDVRSTNKMNNPNVQVFAPSLWYNSSGAFAYMNRDSFLPSKWIRVQI